MVDRGQRQAPFQLVEVGEALRTDAAELESHADPVPLLHRTGRRHEAQLAAEDRRVLEPEVRLDGTDVGRRAAGQRDEHAAQFAELRFDDTGAHLRGVDLGVDHATEPRDHSHGDYEEAQVARPLHRATNSTRRLPLVPTVLARRQISSPTTTVLDRDYDA